MYRQTFFAAVALLIAQAACSSSTPPQQFGELKSKITTGRVQSSVVAGAAAGEAVNLSYREPLTTAQAVWEQIILPTLVFAQSSTIKVQPGAVACIREDQQILIPKTRCVVADALGNSRFDWLPATKAGTHQALASSQYGLETTKEDTVTITVVAAAVDSLAFFDNIAMRTSPAVYSVDHLTDKYGNAVPYRMPSDARLTAQDTVLGSVGARTLTFAASSADNTWRTVFLTGNNGVSIAQFTYRLLLDAGVAKIQAAICGLKVSPCASQLWK